MSIPATQLTALKAAARQPGKGGVEARQLLTTLAIAWNEAPAAVLAPVPAPARQAARVTCQARQARRPAGRAPRIVRARAHDTSRLWGVREVLCTLLVIAAALCLHGGF